jgi:hypothetical protein
VAQGLQFRGDQIGHVGQGLVRVNNTAKLRVGENHKDYHHDEH